MDSTPRLVPFQGRPRTQHGNSDNVRKRTNIYVHREKIAEKMPKIGECFQFLTQQEFEALPILSYKKEHGHPIQDHPEMPPKLNAGLPLKYILSKQDQEVEATTQPDGDRPWYPAKHWKNKNMSTVNEHVRPKHLMSVTTNTTTSRLHR